MTYAPHEDQLLSAVLESLRAGAPPNESAEKVETKESELLSGLMVPIAPDGFCLTAAHNLGRGKAMDSFSRQIGKHNFGPAYTIVQLDSTIPNLFFQFTPNGGRIVSIRQKMIFGTKRFLPEESALTKMKVLSRDLFPEDFVIIQKILKGNNFALMLRIRVIKIWDSEDLALVQVPFPTPVHYMLAENAPAIGNSVKVFGNPSIRSSRIDFQSEIVSDEPMNHLPLDFAEFYPIWMAHCKAGLPGDSGGPVTDSNGCLVGINVGTFSSRKNKMIDLAIGLRRGPLEEVIESARLSGE